MQSNLLAKLVPDLLFIGCGIFSILIAITQKPVSFKFLKDLFGPQVVTPEREKVLIIFFLVIGAILLVTGIIGIYQTLSSTK